MNLTEKILYHQSIGVDDTSVKPGDVILCRVARTLASEMTWVSMRLTYEALGKPKIWRKDRFWLAIDHTVDPSNYNDPKRKALIKACEDFAKEADLVDFFGPNQTILHTEFYRQYDFPSFAAVSLP
jgi:homoaconitate hydratase